MGKIRGTARRGGQVELLARFLAQRCDEVSITQHQLAAVLPKVSQSTISRWFRGKGYPQPEDLAALSEALQVPTQTLVAIILLDHHGSGDMLTTITAGLQLALSCKSFYCCGASMAAAVPHIRMVRPDTTSIALSVLAPKDPGSATDWARMHSHERMGIGALAATFPGPVVSLVLQARLNPATRGRVWVRDASLLGLELPSGSPAGQLIANEWMAIVAPPMIPGGPLAIYEVAFRGERYWMDHVTRYMYELDVVEGAPGRHLIWDSIWTPDEPRHARLTAELRRATDLYMGPIEDIAKGARDAV